MNTSDNKTNEITPIRVGKYVRRGFAYSTPQYKDHIPIRVHSMEKEYGELSPYRLSDARGRTIENLWQFSKVYPAVDKSVQYKGYTKNIIWECPAQVHYSGDPTKLTLQNLDINQLKYDFWEWRRAGFNCDFAIRYPNSHKGRHKVVGAIWPTLGLYAEDEYFKNDKALVARPFEYKIDEKIPIYNTSTGQLISDKKPPINFSKNPIQYDILGYVEARKRIYCGLYAELVKIHPRFIQLCRELNKGNKLIISEVDGPKYDTMYPYNLVENDSIPFTYDICKHLINDVTHPFGHGYTIAALLMGWDDLITDINHVTLGGDLNHYVMKPSK
jgi:hypothetical protein